MSLLNTFVAGPDNQGTGGLKSLDMLFPKMIKHKQLREFPVYKDITIEVDSLDETEDLLGAVELKDEPWRDPQNERLIGSCVNLNYGVLVLHAEHSRPVDSSHKEVKLVPCVGPTFAYKKAAAWKAQHIVLQPAVAGMAESIMDRNLSNMATAINHMLPNASKEKSIAFAAKDRALIQTLLASEYEVTRFAWRFAIVWAAKSFVECHRERLNTYADFSLQHRKVVNNAADYINALGEKANWLAYMGTVMLPVSASQTYAVLSVVASHDPMLEAGSKELKLPSVCDSWPAVDGASLLYITASNPNDSGFSLVSAAEVWEIASHWAQQHGVTAILRECAHNVVSMMHSRDKAVAPVFCSETLLVGLPTCKAEACVLLPLQLQLAEYGGTEDVLPEPDFLDTVYRSAILTIAMECGVRQTLREMGASKNAMMLSKSMKHMHKRVMYQACGVTPVLVGAQHCMNQMGLSSKIGRAWANTCMPANDVKAKWPAWMVSKIDWETILPLLTCMPENMNSKAMLKPMTPVDPLALLTGVWYGIEVKIKDRSWHEAVVSLVSFKDVDFALRVWQSDGSALYFKSDVLDHKRDRCMQWMNYGSGVIEGRRAELVFKVNNGATLLDMVRTKNLLLGTKLYFEIETDAQVDPVAAAYGGGFAGGDAPASSGVTAPLWQPQQSGDSKPPSYQPTPHVGAMPVRQGVEPGDAGQESDNDNAVHYLSDMQEDGGDEEVMKQLADIAGIDIAEEVEAQGKDKQADRDTLLIIQEKISPMPGDELTHAQSKKWWKEVTISKSNELSPAELAEAILRDNILRWEHAVTGDAHGEVLINTFGQLARLTPEQIRDDSGLMELPLSICDKMDKTDWIAALARIRSANRAIACDVIIKWLELTRDVALADSLKARMQYKVAQWRQLRAALRISPEVTPSELLEKAYVWSNPELKRYEAEKKAHDDANARRSERNQPLVPWTDAKGKPRVPPPAKPITENLMSTIKALTHATGGRQTRDIMWRALMSGLTAGEFLVGLAPKKKNKSFDMDASSRNMDGIQRGIAERENEAMRETINSTFVGAIDSWTSVSEMTQTVKELEETICMAFEITPAEFTVELKQSLAAYGGRRKKAMRTPDVIEELEGFKQDVLKPGETDESSSVPPSKEIAQGIRDDGAAQQVVDAAGTKLGTIVEHWEELVQEAAGSMPVVEGVDEQAKDFGVGGSDAGTQPSAPSPASEAPGITTATSTPTVKPPGAKKMERGETETPVVQQTEASTAERPATQQELAAAAAAGIVLPPGAIVYTSGDTGGRVEFSD